MRRLGLTEEQLQEKMVAQSKFDDEVIPGILDFLMEKLKLDADHGPPSVLQAISLAAGLIIAKAPKDMRGQILTATASRITGTMNDALPEHEKLEIVVGSDIDRVQRKLQQIQDEALTVTPPVLH